MARDPVSCSSRPGESRACPFQSEGRPCQAKLDQPPGISRGDSSQPQPEAHLQGLASKALLLLELERPPPTGHTAHGEMLAVVQGSARSMGGTESPYWTGEGGTVVPIPPSCSLPLLASLSSTAPSTMGCAVKLLKGSLYKSRGFYLI